MDNVADFIARARAAAEFDFEADGVRFRLRTLGPFDLRPIVAEHGDKIITAQVPILQAGILGWAGLPAGDVLPGERGELPYARELVPLAANARPAAFDAAFHALIERAAARRQRIAEEAKN